MNLVELPWIPARRRSGVSGRIAPWELTESFDTDPWVEVAAPRPDFDGALVQFLIGLLQTCFAPADSASWRARLSSPPRPEDLKAAFSRVSDAFLLDGDGPRFLQDLTLEASLGQPHGMDSEEGSRPIAELLIGSPTGVTLKENADFFVKRGSPAYSCSECAAAALLTLQVNAPQGGRGHLTGVRGGGPITTIVLGADLWATCWLNVLDRGLLEPLGNGQRHSPDETFPWLAKTRTSDRGPTTPEDVSPWHLYWAMPRRVRLVFEALDTDCEICGRRGTASVSRFLTKGGGTKYSGPWRHPLSPHFVAPDGSPLPLHGQPGGLGYRNWLGIAVSFADEKGTREAAAVVSRYLRFTGEDARIWAFGYDMDKMKARAWQDATMPVLACPAAIKPLFEGQIAALIRASELIAYELRRRVREAVSSGAESRGDMSFVTDRYWRETEPEFYGLLPGLRSVLEGGHDPTDLLEGWLRSLAREAEAIFDDSVQASSLDVVDPKRVALAWHNLRRGIYGKKVRGILGLSDPAAESPGPKKKGKR